MLAPQQTIMRANANLHCEGAGASLPTLNHLDFEHPIYFLPCLGAIFELLLSGKTSKNIKFLREVP